MTLRKFGIEHGGAAINPDDPQGLSKTALNQLVTEEQPEDEDRREDEGDGEECPDGV